MSVLIYRIDSDLHGCTDRLLKKVWTKEQRGKCAFCNDRLLKKVWTKAQRGKGSYSYFN